MKKLLVLAFAAALFGLGCTQGTTKSTTKMPAAPTSTHPMPPAATPAPKPGTEMPKAEPKPGAPKPDTNPKPK